MSDFLLSLWESTIAGSLQRNVASPIPTTDNDTLVKASQLKINSVKQNVVGYENLSPSTPAASDPLVKFAQQGERGKTAPLAQMGQNLVNYDNINNNTPAASDPLVAATYQPAGGKDSIQIQLLAAPYNKGKLYSNIQNPNTLMFPDGQLPPSLIPPEGDINSSDFHNGSLYRPPDGNPLTTYAPIAASMPNSSVNSADVFALAQYARNIAMEFGVIARPGDDNSARARAIAKGAAFLATQVLLTTFNPADPQNGGVLNMIYNPASFLSCLVPGIRGNAISSPNLPAVASVDGKVYSNMQGALPSAADRHLLMRQGAYVKQTNASDILNGTLINHPGYIGDLSQPGATDTLSGQPLRLPGKDGVTVEQQVGQTDSIHVAANGNYMVNLYTPDRPYSLQQAIDNDWLEQNINSANTNAQDLVQKNIFKPAQNMPAASVGSVVDAVVNAIKPPAAHLQYRWYSSFSSGKTAAKSTTFPNNFDSAFPNEDPDTCLVDETNAISDDDNYMPFTFQDLRDATPSLLYFRAFLKSGLTETFQPSWQTENYYGRVDQVPTYMNTMRSIQLAFDVVAWSPKDLSVMWTKLTKLQSMVYPTFDSNRYINAGPMIRMRIGDLFTSHKQGLTKKGLPGYITSLNFAYDDDIWNIKNDYRIPRKVSVSMAFVVIHEGNPGIYVDDTGTGVFGTLEFRGNNNSTPGQSVVPAELASGLNVSTTPTDLGNVMPGGVRGIVDTIQGITEAPISDAPGYVQSVAATATGQSEAIT